MQEREALRNTNNQLAADKRMVEEQLVLAHCFDKTPNDPLLGSIRQCALFMLCYCYMIVAHYRGPQMRLSP
jgi:hypothetical protein